MNRLFFTLCLLCLLGCGDEGFRDFEIRVTGDSPFFGTITTWRDGEQERHSVHGTPPMSYHETCVEVYASFRKTQAGGKLGVEILKEGLESAGHSKSTTAEFGEISVSAQ